MNVEAINYFISNVFNKLLQHDNAIHLLIGGNICSAFSPNEIHPNIELKGRYDNPDDFYLLGDIVINPVSKGTGLKIKTLEALAHGKVTITDPHSAAGIYDATNAPLKVAHTPDEYMKAILHYMQQPQAIILNQTQCRSYIDSLNNYISLQYKEIFDKI